MDHLTEEQLNEYLDEALPHAARVEVSAHLDRCEACRMRGGLNQ